MRVRGRTTRTTSGPKEMLGTKWPSMMSRWSQSALARWARMVSSASLPKLAASRDGAIIIGGEASKTVGRNKIYAEIWRRLPDRTGWGEELREELIDFQTGGTRFGRVEF